MNNCHLWILKIYQLDIRNIHYPWYIHGIREIYAKIYASVYYIFCTVVTCLLQSAPTHACITFDDGSTSVVPTKNIVNQSNLKVNGMCEVKWTDGKVYYATIVALGKASSRLCISFDLKRLFLQVGAKRWKPNWQKVSHKHVRS